jgi:hypothetical protein
LEFLRGLLAAGAVALLAALPVDQAAAQGTAAQKWSEDPGTHCRFVAPLSLTAGPTYWVGPCQKGLASGSGVLRRRDGNLAGPAFYGDIKDGIPSLGVVDLDGGYRVGKFKDGDIGDDKDLEPQVRLDAFRAAENAAKKVAVYYRGLGNPASAKVYEDVAKTLQAQNDEDPELPEDVQEYMVRRGQCDHFRNEPAEDEKRQAEVAKAAEKFCTGTDAELARLKRAHATNKAVQEALSAFDPNIE